MPISTLSRSPVLLIRTHLNVYIRADIEAGQIAELTQNSAKYGHAGFDINVPGRKRGREGSSLKVDTRKTSPSHSLSPNRGSGTDVAPISFSPSPPTSPVRGNQGVTAASNAPGLDAVQTQRSSRDPRKIAAVASGRSVTSRKIQGSDEDLQLPYVTLHTDAITQIVSASDVGLILTASLDGTISLFSHRCVRVLHPYN